MSLFSKLQDPDNVGSSEYRAIYDSIGDAEGTDDERDAMIVTMLQEFAGHSLSMLKAIGHPIQLKVISENGHPILSCDDLELSLLNVIQIDGDAESLHVLSYKDVSVYQTVKHGDMISDCWYATYPNCDWESEDAFDVRDLDPPPEDFKPEGVDHDNSDHLALAWAIDQGKLVEDGLRQQPHTLLGKWTAGAAARHFTHPYRR